MNDFEAILGSAAAESQAVLGEPFIGPDGKNYTGVFRSASAFDLAAAGQEMQAHGYGDKTLMIVAATRSQFPAPPYAWRRGKIFRQSSPVQECTVLTLNTDDPFFYVFPVIFRQPNG